LFDILFAQHNQYLLCCLYAMIILLPWNLIISENKKCGHLLSLSIM